MLGSRVSERVGGQRATDERLRRKLRLLIGIFTALLWTDNLSEHYRGAFRVRAMWIPIVLTPAAAGAALLSVLSARPTIRHLFSVLSFAQGTVALVGFALHQQRILRRPGQGWRMYVFNAWYGPPALAPLQYLGFALLGLVASLPSSLLGPLLKFLPLARLLPLYVAVNIPPLWMEIAYLHWRASFQDRLQWLPLAALPAVAAASAASALSDGQRAASAHRAGATSLIVLGFLGTVFHLVGLGRRYRGYSRKALLFNWLSGPPVPAPLQVVGLGLIARAAGSNR